MHYFSNVSCIFRCHANVFLAVIVLFTATVGGCWASTEEDDDGPTVIVSGASCTVDAGEIYRCNGEVLEQCDGESWSTVEDCAANGGTCEQTQAGMAQCAGGQQCATGETNGKCNPGSSCTAPSDCASGVCGDNDICLPSTCSNGEQDGDETGPDCGGSCPKCVGDPCSRDEHCVTNYCKSSACAAPSCTDKQKNGTETGADCGGDCSPCPVGEGCEGDDDCKTGRCEGGTCADLPATCNDGEKNGKESDTDCGGSDCGACALEQNCKKDGDCLSNYCKFGVCKEATCMDKAQNQGETDEDCGGENCPACALGEGCKGNRDCKSGRCSSGTCASCEDGKKNGGEAGVDCGGPCKRCPSGQSCNTGSDCATGRCEGGKCASCTDGRQSGSENGVDCGGPCRCCTPNRCGSCGPLPEEKCNGKDDDCDSQTDEGLSGKAPLCNKQSGVCSGARSECRGASGWKCDDKVLGNHSPDYTASGDVPCDGKDNDCDGKTDEDKCDDGNACTSDFCGANNQCQTSQHPDAYACGSGSSNADKLKRCDRGRCETKDLVCVCSSSGCALYYETSSGSVKKDTSGVFGCACDGSDHLKVQGQQGKYYCYNCTKRTSTSGDTHYVCMGLN